MDVLSRGNVLNVALEIIAEIIIPPPPVYVLPSLPSAAGKLCSVCNNPICSRYTDLAYHCEDPSCHNVYHLSITCSCFLDPRGTTRAHLLYSNLALPFIFFSNSKWDSSFQPDTFCTPHTSVIKLTLESRYVSSWRKKLKKTVLSVLLLCVLTLSQWDAKYLERASIRNAALVQKLQTTMISGNVKSAPSFSRIV